MSGEEWLKAFVSGWLFWFYFVSGKIKKRDMTLVRSLDICASALIPIMGIESVKYFERDFKYTGCEFSEMTNPSELNSAVGSLAMNFSTLEDEISSAVICLMDCKIEEGLVVASEMSFRAKLSVFSSLMRSRYQQEEFPFSEKEFEDLLYMCSKSEEMRNRLLHSSWVYDHAKKQVRRRKLSAKMKKGFRHEEEPLTAGQVLDIADYIIYTAMSIEEFVANCFPGYEPPLRQFVWP